MVVIVIMIVIGGLAITTIRKESMSNLIKRTSNEFRSLCSRARYNAMESGQDRMVVYDPERQMFFMARPTMNAEEDSEYEDGFVIFENVRWQMPEEFELTTEDNHPLEVFRFYPDGGASGRWKLNLGCKDREGGMVLEVARLTGTVTAREMAEGE